LSNSDAANGTHEVDEASGDSGASFTVNKKAPQSKGPFDGEDRTPDLGWSCNMKNVLGKECVAAIKSHHKNRGGGCLVMCRKALEMLSQV